MKGFLLALYMNGWVHRIELHWCRSTRRLIAR